MVTTRWWVYWMVDWHGPRFQKGRPWRSIQMVLGREQKQKEVRTIQNWMGESLSELVQGASTQQYLLSVDEQCHWALRKR
jgi:hypothetical protein